MTKTVSISNCLLNSPKNGKLRKLEFDSRMVPGEPSTDVFYSTLSRFKLENFENSCIKATITKDGKSKEIAYQRDILGILVSQSKIKKYANKTGVDMEKVFTYPLAPVSIPFCTPDGSNRKTTKSKLYDAAMDDEVTIIDNDNLTGIPNLENYFLDVVAFIRIMTNTSGSNRELAWKVNPIPVQYRKMYLVCDTYKEGSIKTSERRSRGSGKRYVIKSPNLKIPSDFSNFLKNGDNKTVLLYLIEQAFIQAETTVE